MDIMDIFRSRGVEGCLQELVALYEELKALLDSINKPTPTTTPTPTEGDQTNA